MTWEEAVEAMRAGHQVRQRSQQKHELIGDVRGVPVYEGGEEPCAPAAAWTDDDKPVRVFRGAWSREMFVPDDEHRAATDWEVA